MHPYGPADFPWMWAAYKMGAFSKDPFFVEGATPAELREGFEMLTSKGLWMVSTAWHTERKQHVPMCIIAGDFMETALDGGASWRRVYEPHVIWMPWATPRNKIEAGLRFFDEMRRKMCVVVYALPSEHDYFVTMCRYGLMERVGTIRGYFGFDRDPAQVWQTRYSGRQA